MQNCFLALIWPLSKDASSSHRDGSKFDPANPVPIKPRAEIRVGQARNSTGPYAAEPPATGKQSAGKKQPRTKDYARAHWQWRHQPVEEYYLEALVSASAYIFVCG